MPYARLASSVDQVIENAVRFRDLMEGSDSAAKTALIATIPYFRSWVAVLVDGEFVLAPSKWVGYVDMDPDFYVRHHHDQLDGRHTERAMAPWLRQVGTDHALWDQLHGLCARHGKRPNAACRISILNTEPSSTAAPTRIAELLVAVFETLAADQQLEVRRQIGRLIPRREDRRLLTIAEG